MWGHHFVYTWLLKVVRTWRRYTYEVICGDGNCRVVSIASSIVVVFSVNFFTLVNKKSQTFLYRNCVKTNHKSSRHQKPVVYNIDIPSKIGMYSLSAAKSSNEVLWSRECYLYLQLLLFILDQNNSKEHACQYLKDVICRDLDSANALKVTDILFALQIGKNNIQQTMGF